MALPPVGAACYVGLFLDWLVRSQKEQPEPHLATDLIGCYTDASQLTLGISEWDAYNQRQCAARENVDGALPFLQNPSFGDLPR